MAPQQERKRNRIRSPPPSAGSDEESSYSPSSGTSPRPIRQRQRIYTSCENCIGVSHPVPRQIAKADLSSQTRHSRCDPLSRLPESFPPPTDCTTSTVQPNQPLCSLYHAGPHLPLDPRSPRVRTPHQLDSIQLITTSSSASRELELAQAEIARLQALVSDLSSRLERQSSIVAPSIHLRAYSPAPIYDLPTPATLCGAPVSEIEPEDFPFPFTAHPFPRFSSINPPHLPVFRSPYLPSHQSNPYPTPFAPYEYQQPPASYHFPPLASSDSYYQFPPLPSSNAHHHALQTLYHHDHPCEPYHDRQNSRSFEPYYDLPSARNFEPDTSFDPLAGEIPVQLQTHEMDGDLRGWSTRNVDGVSWRGEGEEWEQGERAWDWGTG